MSRTSVEKFDLSTVQECVRFQATIEAMPAKCDAYGHTPDGNDRLITRVVWGCGHAWGWAPGSDGYVEIIGGSVE